MEKLYSSKMLLKMIGGGMPHPHLLLVIYLGLHLTGSFVVFRFNLKLILPVLMEQEL